jgi:hypothetical protein
MKALSLTQPYGSLVAIGAKKVETRSWATKHRGLIAIHAAKGFPGWAKDQCYSVRFADALWPNANPKSVISDIVKELPLGAIIAVASITACESTNYFGLLSNWIGDLSAQEKAFGDYSKNRYGWFLDEVQPLITPIPCRGALSLWDVHTDVEQVIKEQLKMEFV